MLDMSSALQRHAAPLKRKLPDPLFKIFVKTLTLLFREKLFTGIYEKNKHLFGLAYIRSMIENLNLSYTLNPMQLENIPSTGPLLVIANHPTGAIDTILLLDLIASAREDKKVKIIANHMLMNVAQVAPLLIPVDNINGSITKNSLKMVYESLKNGEVVIFFPEGKVDRLTFQGIKDKDWKPSFLKIAKRTQTPILPIHIKGRNSILFYLISLLVPKRISGLLLVNELANGGKRKPLSFTIGNVIPFSSFNNPKVSIKECMQKFYRHVYSLKDNKRVLLNTEITVAEGENRKLLKREIDAAKFLGYSHNGSRIIVTDYKSSPIIINEIGRVREISFRAIGSGGGRSRDLDSYDQFYKHLVLWSDDDLEIVGAYRIGECQDILTKRSVESLFLSKFCNFNDDFMKITDQTVELGRSFVQPRYWKTRAFNNLWQAVTLYLADNPEIRYTYGMVSINADYPDKANAILVYFYSHYFLSEEKYLIAKQPYAMKQDYSEEFSALFKNVSYKEGFKILKNYMKTLNVPVPTLIKQYVELYEEGAVKYFGFCEAGPTTHGMVCGFLICDNKYMKKSILERNLKPSQTICNSPKTLNS